MFWYFFNCPSFSPGSSRFSSVSLDLRPPARIFYSRYPEILSVLSGAVYLISHCCFRIKAMCLSVLNYLLLQIPAFIIRITADFTYHHHAIVRLMFTLEPDSALLPDFPRTTGLTYGWKIFTILSPHERLSSLYISFCWLNNPVLLKVFVIRRHLFISVRKTTITFR